MENSKIGYWLQILANVGLLAGLVLVGMQISQSNTIARATLATVAYQQETDRWLTLMGENPSAAIAKSYTEPENLTTEEILVVLAGMDWFYSMMRRNSRMQELGIFDEHWHQFPAQWAWGAGQAPLAREFVMNHEGDEWWVKEMKKVASEQPKMGVKEFVQYYKDVASSYAEQNDRPN